MLPKMYFSFQIFSKKNWAKKNDKYCIVFKWNFISFHVDTCIRNIQQNYQVHINVFNRLIRTFKAEYIWRRKTNAELCSMVHVTVSASDLCSIFIFYEVKHSDINTAFCVKTNNTDPPHRRRHESPIVQCFLHLFTQPFPHLLPAFGPSCPPTVWFDLKKDMTHEEKSSLKHISVTLDWCDISPACGALMRWMFFLISLISAAFSSSLPFFSLWK